MCNLQFHTVNIPPQQQPMLCRLFFRRHLYQYFLLHEKTGQLGKNRRIADNFGISASKKLGAEGLLLQKELVDAFDESKNQVFACS